MSQCPHCQGELVPDPKNSQKVLCYNCKKRFDAEAVGNFWQEQNQAPVMTPNNAFESNMDSTTMPMPAQAEMNTTGYNPQPFTDPYSTPVPNQYGQQPYQPGPSRGLAIAALVFGILAILGCLIPIFNVFSIVLGIAAVILGVVAIVKVNKGTAAGKGMGIASIILGVLSIVISVAISLLMFNLFSTVEPELTELNNIVENYNSENGNVEELEEELNQWAENVSDKYNLNENEEYATYNENTLSNTNISENNYNQTDATTAPSGLTNNWQDMQIVIDGYLVNLGATTLKDFSSQTGWELDFDASGGYTSVNPNETESVLTLKNTKYPNTIMFADVHNPTSEIADASECRISSIDIERPYDLSEPCPNVMIANNIGLGATPEQVVEALGLPQDQYDGGSYASFDYNTGDFDKYLTVGFTDNQASSIKLNWVL